MRLADGTLDAVAAFGDREKAVRWLSKPNRTLGGRKPLDLLATPDDAALFRQLLGNVAYGGVA